MGLFFIVEANKCYMRGSFKAHVVVCVAGFYVGVCGAAFAYFVDVLFNGSVNGVIKAWGG